MLIKGMTLQEMANYLVSLSMDQMEKLVGNSKAFQTTIDELDNLSSEDSIYMAMVFSATICKSANDTMLRELAFQDMSEGEHCVVLAEMRKRNLI